MAAVFSILVLIDFDRQVGDNYRLSNTAVSRLVGHHPACSRNKCREHGVCTTSLLGLTINISSDFSRQAIQKVASFKSKVQARTTSYVITSTSIHSPIGVSQGRRRIGRRSSRLRCGIHIWPIRRHGRLGNWRQYCNGSRLDYYHVRFLLTLPRPAVCGTSPVGGPKSCSIPRMVNEIQEKELKRCCKLLQKLWASVWMHSVCTDPSVTGGEYTSHRSEWQKGESLQEPLACIASTE